MSTSASITVRPAAKRDVERLGELAGALVRMHHEADPKRFLIAKDVDRGYGHWLGGELKRPGAVVLVAEVDGEVVGYTYATVEGRDWEALLDAHGKLHDVFVDPKSRRGGIGKRLVEATIRALEEKGAERIVLSTMVGNVAARKLFEAAGFAPTMIEMTRAT